MSGKAEDKGSKKKKEKRQLILEAAVQEFARKGYHNTRMEEIAQTAGIGKGTIYEYFESKLKLFQAMMEDSLRAYFVTLEENGQKPVTMEQRLTKLVESHISFCLANKELTRVVFWDPDTFDSELRDWTVSIRAEKLQRTADLIREGIDQGEVRSDLDIRIMSEVILHTLGAFWYPLVVEGWDADPAVMARQYTEIIMNGIRK